jgi:pimeloyl-ACP methyl ester carboxylesterase
MKTASVKGITGQNVGQNPIHYEISGAKDAPVILWAHGWGQNLSSFKPMASSLENMGHHIFVDFPGFGQSPVPPVAWGTKEYADAMAAFLRTHTGGKVIWVGHSFGCRVGLQMAIRHPELIDGLFLIGGAGLRRKRSPWQNIVLYTKIYTFKTLKKMIPLGVSEEWLKSRFGSPDYRNAGAALRPTMMKVNSEDMTHIVPQITCPVMLIYGTNDTETPPEIGERLKKLINGAEMVHLEGQDHYSVLGTGRHPVTRLLKEFIETRIHA